MTWPANQGDVATNVDRGEGDVPATINAVKGDVPPILHVAEDDVRGHVDRWRVASLDGLISWSVARLCTTMWSMGANKDAKDTKRAAMLLAEAMDGLQSLFIETSRARLGSGPPVSYDEWERRKQAALARRVSAAAIGNDLESRTPQAAIDQPAFRRSAKYLFYVASRRGLARQFSAVDIMHIASNLFWVAGDENDGELAAATAEHANELGQYALYLLQAAPTLRADAASVEKMEVLFASLEKSYGEAKFAMGQAVAAIERLNEGPPAQETAPESTDRPSPEVLEAIGSELESQVVGGVVFRVGQSVQITEGTYEGFRGQIDSISDDGETLRVIVSIFGRETPVDLDLPAVRSNE